MLEPNNIRTNTRHFYNTVADKFSQTRTHWWQGFDFIRKYWKREGKVLDFGCGNGRLVEYLKTLDNLNNSENKNKDDLIDRYQGVDISEKLIQHAKNRYPGFNFEVIEEESKLPLEENSFDQVYSIAVFHHFNPEMASRALKELKRILKDKGNVIITVWYLWNRNYLFYLFKNILKGKFSLSAEIPFKENDQGTYFRYCYWWTPRHLRKIAEAAGYEIVETGHTFDQFNRKRNIYWVLKKP